MPKSPHVQGASGCWLTTPSSHEQGVDGKDGQVRERVWVLVTAGLVSAPCSCSANKKRLLLSTLPKFIPPTSCEWNLGKLKLWWSSHEGKRSSWRCHSCLHGAVISSTCYLLWAHCVIILTTQHICFSGAPLPTSSVCPDSDRRSISPALAALCEHVTLLSYRQAACFLQQLL